MNEKKERRRWWRWSKRRRSKFHKRKTLEKEIIPHRKDFPSIDGLSDTQTHSSNTIDTDTATRRTKKIYLKKNSKIS